MTRNAFTDESSTVRLPDVVDRRDPGVRHGGRGAGLAQEALPPALVAGELGGQHLERDAALEAGVAGAVDDAHPAFAQLLEDLEVGERPQRFTQRARRYFFRGSSAPRSLSASEPKLPAWVVAARAA